MDQQELNNHSNNDSKSFITKETALQNTFLINQAPTKIHRLSGQVSKYNISNFKRFLWILLAMFVSSLAARYFIIYANIFSGGISGLSQGIVYTIVDSLDLANTNEILYNTVKNLGFYLVNFFFNIFILIFAMKKFGKTFAYWSAGAFLISMIWAFFFNYTPGFNTAAFIPGFMPVYSGDDWEAIAVTFAVTSIAGTIAGILMGISTGIVFRLGISGLGFDPIGKYLAKEKKISIKKAMFIFSFTNSLIWILIGQGIQGTITSFTTFIEVMFNARVVGTVLFLAFNSAAVGWFYPSGKKVVIDVNSSKGIEISDKLNAIGYHRAHSIYNVVGGKSRKEREVIRTVLMAEEMYEFINIIAIEDEEAFIVVSQALEVYGNFNSSIRYKDPKTEEEHRKEDRRKIKETIYLKTHNLINEIENKDIGNRHLEANYDHLSKISDNNTTIK